jgi:hypothetical protein
MRSQEALQGPGSENGAQYRSSLRLATGLREPEWETKAPARQNQQGLVSLHVKIITTDIRVGLDNNQVDENKQDSAHFQAFGHIEPLLGEDVIFHNYPLMENDTGSHRIMP